MIDKCFRKLKEGGRSSAEEYLHQHFSNHVQQRIPEPVGNNRPCGLGENKSTLCCYTLQKITLEFLLLLTIERKTEV